MNAKRTIVLGALISLGFCEAVHAQDSCGVRCLSSILDSSGAVTSVRLQGDYAFVGANILHVVDVSDPAHPTVVDSGGIGDVYALALQGGYAFLINHYGRLTSVNITDPTRLGHRLVTWYKSQPYFWEVEVRDTLAFVTGPEGIYIVNIARLDSLRSPRDSLKQVGYFRTRGHADGLAVDGNLVYYNDYDDEGGNIDGFNFGIIDVSDPTTPIGLAEVPHSGGNGVAYADGYAYSSSGEGCLDVFDVSDPTSPNNVKRILNEGNWAVTVSDHHLFVTESSCRKFYIYDISNPQEMTLTGWYRNRNEVDGQSLGIVVRDGLAYVAEGTCLSIYDCREALGIPVDRASEVPASPLLLVAFPNPFNSTTQIFFDLPKASPLSVRIYDLSGRQVATLMNGNLQAGNHEVTWQAGGVSSGNYLVKMETPGFSVVRKVVMTK